MIELVNLHKVYRSRGMNNHVLDGVNLSFPEGENLGVLGRNGAGKSTLLRIIAGIEAADEGQVIRKGRVSWPIGFAGGFNGSLSGEENCRFIARIYGCDLDELSEFAREFSELGRYFFEPVRTYSSGMKARLAFGVSMGIDFDVYLVDEVTAVGDKPFQEKCRAAFAAKQEHATLVMVSHSMATIRAYCDRCAVLERGKLTLFGDVESANAALEAAFESNPRAKAEVA